MSESHEAEPIAATEETRRIVEGLVSRYRRNAEQYRSVEYKEAQVRQEFIDPFFAALGWDMANEQGFAEQYKDVVHEPSIKMGEETKAPDYSFRIGGQRKFFLEAKKPSVRVKDDPGPAYQLRRYAWSAKLPLSILTDFEELAVYDCRKRPKQEDSPSVARVDFIRYEDYLDRLDDIYAIFAKDAILKGSFDRYVEKGKGQRGTTEVDAEFLKEIEAWRELLAKDIAKNNADLSVYDLNHAVQATIDRILFFRIAEDRGVEEYGRLRGLVNGSKLYAGLCDLYHEADEKYNAGLFDFSESGDTLCPRLTISDKALKGILAKLYYPECPYEFSVLGADILGAVYEQFLGKVIRLTAGHRAKVEEKPEVKKAGGVYYTPTYIVDYIVKHTVGEALEEAGTPEKAEKLRILDPACGSGSFLLGAYECLLRWHLDYYSSHSPKKHARGKDPAIVQTGERDWRLSTSERKRILQNNVYGVDIDAQAVEVTKLNLLLKCMEGETSESIDGQLRLAHERVLPNIDANIKCGNSLIGPDYYSGRLLPDPDEMRRVNPFDWERQFEEIMKAGGFDCVIGNPPYVVMGADLFEDSVTTYLQRYSVAQYKADLFHIFVQKGLDLLKEKGRFGYIVPNPWFTQKFAHQLRGYILANSAIEEIVVFEHLVFPSAAVYTALLFLQKGVPDKEHETAVRRPIAEATLSAIENAPVHTARQQDWLQSEGFPFETRRTGALGVVIGKVEAVGVRLEEVARASLGCQAYNRSKHTVEQIENRVFHADRKESKEYLRELAGKDVARYRLSRVRGQWIRYGPWLHDYRTMDWFQGPRILVREITGASPHRICACYVEETYCNYKTILNVNPSPATDFSMKYLLGLLNSTLMSVVYPIVSNKIVARGFPRLSVGDLKALPVRTIDFDDAGDVGRHDRMVGLVERMLELHERLGKAQTQHDRELLERQIAGTDREIDGLVYELYELTDEEIGIVEASTRRE